MCLESEYELLCRIELLKGGEGSGWLTHKRSPYWSEASNLGYRSGPMSGSMRGDNFEFLQNEEKRLLGASCSGSGYASTMNLGLGAIRNQVDVRLYDVSPFAKVEASDIDYVEGEIQHKNGHVFDRRAVIPILGGTLSIHMTGQTYEDFL